MWEGLSEEKKKRIYTKGSVHIKRTSSAKFRVIPVFKGVQKSVIFTFIFEMYEN